MPSRPGDLLSVIAEVLSTIAADFQVVAGVVEESRDRRDSIGHPRAHVGGAGNEKGGPKSALEPSMRGRYATGLTVPFTGTVMVGLALSLV
jgi:hypothetical protein